MLTLWEGHSSTGQHERELAEELPSQPGAACKIQSSMLSSQHELSPESLTMRSNQSKTRPNQHKTVCTTNQKPCLPSFLTYILPYIPPSLVRLPRHQCVWQCRPGVYSWVPAAVPQHTLSWWHLHRGVLHTRVYYFWYIPVTKAHEHRGYHLHSRGPST